MATNPETYQSGWPSAVIAGGFQTGVLGMRTLARRGVPVCSVECDRSMACFYETYGPAYACPNPDADGAGWLAFMLDLSKKLGGRPVLIASSDRFVNAMAHYATELEPAFRFTGAAARLGELDEKVTQFALAEQFGMPIPRSEHVSTTEEAEKFASTAQYPCLLKPVANRDWDVFLPSHPLYGKKVATAENQEEFMGAFALAHEVSPALVAQEIIQGPDTAKLCYFSCYDQTGRRIGYSVFRHLRCHPLDFGSACAMEPMTDEEASRLCDDFLKKIGCKGICEIEMKRDVRTGKLMMIEANPRLSGSGDASCYVGVDMCWLHYLDLAGVPVQPEGANGQFVVHIALCRDFAAIRDGAAAGICTWRSGLATYRSAVFFDFHWREWQNSLHTLDQAARALFGPLVRKIIPK